MSTEMMSFDKGGEQLQGMELTLSASFMLQGKLEPIAEELVLDLPEPRGPRFCHTYWQG